MKICQINSVYGFASTGRACKEFADYINDNTEHYCYTFFSIGKKDKHSFKFGNAFERKIHAFLSRLFCNQGGYSVFSTLSLIKKIRKINPDACIIRNIHSNNVNLEILFNFLKKNKIKTFLYLDDCWFFTGKCTHYSSVNCQKWQSKCFDCPKLKDDNPSWFFDLSYKNHLRKKKIFKDFPSLIVVGVSNWITNEAKKSVVFDKNTRFSTVYNWIDVDLFKPKDNVIKDIEKKYLLSVATLWDESKGLSKLIELSKNISDDYEIWCVGDYNPILKKEKIKFIGRVEDKNQLADLYKNAFCYLNMSLEESFGKTSAESICCGVPVVCFDSTANKEIVEDNGAVLNKNATLNELLNAIYSLNNFKKTNQCRKYAIENFEIKSNVLKILQLIRE